MTSAETPHGTAEVHATNLFPETLATLDELKAAPVGAVIIDSDGDTFERRPHGTWRGNSFPHAITDEVLAMYLPATVENHAELAGLELEGYRLGHLVRVLTNEYAIAISAGTAGVVERIVGPHLFVRFRGGMVVPLLTSEVEPVASTGIHLNARVTVTRAGTFNHGPLDKGAIGVVTGRASGYIEPSWIVSIEGNSPWFHLTADWVFPESALAIA
ncbi:hypothetical protein AB0J80_35910 [Actinoplanes sp. NPDC049548]|uniref:hypothetical protein n=1 Tax=Actinoplanes sp. NPDC049548 TaxID=3155152 RepID=UPI003415424D